MVFKEIKKRKMYRTWQNRNKRTGLVTYIHHTPKNKITNVDFFHFSISCTKRFCGRSECNRIECERKFQYCSLIDKKKYCSFGDCVEAIKEWYKICIG